MATILDFYLFSMLFMSCIFTPSNGGEDVFIDGPAKGHDTDFDQFMKKMFNDMPGEPTIKEEKYGPNAGYRPYWYAYNFAKGWMPEQKERWASSHEDWDYGLGEGSGRGVWGGGNMSLMSAVADGGLGTGDLVDMDLTAGDYHKRVCAANLGKKCVLGLPPEFFTHETIEALRLKTVECDTCTEKNRRIGVVCSVDRTGTVIQETDMCVMVKMNCLGGNAYILSTNGRKYATKFSAYPFLVHKEFVRVSIKGDRDADIRLFNDVPFWSVQKNIYWVVVAGWPFTGPKSAVYADSWQPYLPHDDAYIYFRKEPRWWSDAVNSYTYTEYTIVWDEKTGYFLLSQARSDDWKSKFKIELTDPIPRKFKYIDVAAGWADKRMEFILHGLSVLHEGPCVQELPKDDFPSDTEEVYNRSRVIEDGYRHRLKMIGDRGYRPQDWDAEDGSYIEY